MAPPLDLLGASSSGLRGRGCHPAWFLLQQPVAVRPHATQELPEDVCCQGLELVAQLLRLAPPSFGLSHLLCLTLRPPFSSSGKSSQLPTKSAKTLSPNTRGLRFRPRDINVEVQSSGSATSGSCWAHVWGSGSGVLGGVAGPLPHTLLCYGNLALLVLPREAWLEGSRPQV